MNQPLFKIVLTVILLSSCWGIRAEATLKNEQQNKDSHQNETVSLTIYSQLVPGSNMGRFQQLSWRGNENTTPWSLPGYAIVRVQKNIELTNNKNQWQLNDVASLIDPSTVIFRSLTDPKGTKVAEQNYQFDFASQQGMIDRLIGQEITVQQNIGDQIHEFTGKLLSSQGGLILEDKQNKVISLTHYDVLHYQGSISDLKMSPTLTWEIIANKPGKQTIEASYQTAGMTWWAVYNAVLDENNNKDGNSGFIDLSAWVNIINQSGADYNIAKLSLIAGDVNKINTVQPMMMKTAMGAREGNDLAAPRFSEQSFFDYHLYSLDKSLELPNNANKQIELFPKSYKIPVKKEYLYQGTDQKYYGQVQTQPGDGNTGNNKVDISLKFKNSKDAGLGIPLPSGKIRIMKLNPNYDALELIGEDVLDHTAVDEEVNIKMGSSFDVVGERKQLNFSVDESRRIMEETIEITLKNHKPQDINVTVKENFYRAPNFEILESNTRYEKIAADSVIFPIIVKKSSETKIRYKIRYHW